MPEQLTCWEVTDRLDTEEVIAAYLETAREENDPAFYGSALLDVERARARWGLTKP